MPGQKSPRLFFWEKKFLQKKKKKKKKNKKNYKKKRLIINNNILNEFLNEILNVKTECILYNIFKTYFHRHRHIY